MIIQFTPSARRQFLSAIEYIQADNPTAASKFFQKASSALKRLLRFPESGRRIPEFPSLPHRELLVFPYRFFYRLDSDTIWIIAVWHDAQLPDLPEGQ